MFLGDCQHFYALFANSFEGAAEEAGVVAALCTTHGRRRQNFARKKKKKTVVPLEANIDLTINEAVAEARSIQPREAEHGKEETEVEKDKHHR